MTRPPDHDPMRAFDGVDPPDQWDDIVFRAARPDITVEPAPSPGWSRKPLLVAAAVLAVLGVGGAVLAGRDATRRDDSTTIAGQPADGPDGTVRPPVTDATGAPVTTEAGAPGATDPEGNVITGPGDTSTAPTGPVGSGPSGSPGGPGTTSTPAGRMGNDTTTTTAAPTTVAGDAPGTTIPSDGQTATTTPSTVGPVSTPSTVPSLTVTAAGTPFGTRWILGAMTDATGNRSLGTTQAIVLDATVDGQLSLQVCNVLAGTATLESGRLAASLVATSKLSCGQPIDGHEAWLTSLFASKPTVRVEGSTLVVSNGSKRAEFDAA